MHIKGERERKMQANIYSRSTNRDTEVKTETKEVQTDIEEVQKGHRASITFIVWSIFPKCPAINSGNKSGLWMFEFWTISDKIVQKLDNFVLFLNGIFSSFQMVSENGTKCPVLMAIMPMKTGQ